MPPLPVCHVIEAQDQAAFVKWKAQGRLCLTGLAQKENGTVVCNDCHHHYDTPQCNWVLFPTDLDFFLAREDLDFQRRKQEVQSSGRLLDRIPPTAAEYHQHQVRKGLVSPDAVGGTFTCWILWAFQAGSGQVFQPGRSATRNWHGDATAAICKAGLVPYEKLFGSPAELQELGRSYFDHDRELQRLRGQAETGTQSASQDRGGGHGGGADQPDPEKSGEGSAQESPPQRSSSKRRRSARQQSKEYGASQHKIQEPLVELATSRKPKPRLQRAMYVPPRPTKRIKLERAPPIFEWGPQCSAQDVIDLANFFTIKVGSEPGSSPLRNLEYEQGTCKVEQSS
ncbi:MAG: hypothetical protein Q9207_006389 [Kuettlingeria erythrocarpa]